MEKILSIVLENCYGSQQASYPCLLPMLGFMPPATISAEQCFIDFFQSLWAGNSMCLSSPVDRIALFRVIKECIIFKLCGMIKRDEDSSVQNC